MLKLLRETDVAPHFRRAMKRSASSVVAVPFWGEGAAALLGLVAGSPVRILCNLDHPGCNPNSISEIRDLRIKVRTHPRLHAKIYATENLAVVGSSNASRFGLPAAAGMPKGWVEANASSDDPDFVAEVLDLFEALWSDPESRHVRNSDIKAAIEARKSWPSSVPGLWLAPRPASAPKTLLAACRERPDDFGSVFVASYREDLSEAGNRLLGQVRSGALPAKPGLSASDFRKAWGYQFDGIHEGDWLIDLDCTKPDRPRCRGSARVTGLQLEVDGESHLTIALPGMVRVPGFGTHLRLTPAEKASLVDNASRILARDELLPLPDVIKIIDRRR
ncbi:phospholipase D family protein [Roseomonas xinghualingensis]|uniref:phospholipase D family protein n=1 Tax=Roseomonas xinghualingensis TaxID=2986475 RepID=UPI0021F1AC3D|nr:phospholipase D family protein [Roseomonas sp. SXEYE001]MCV4210209.1 phospholipase D family protein [Roseomonas sp. SXEYE001]